MSIVNRRKVMTSVYFEPGQYAALSNLTEQTRVPMAVYIRDGIELVLAKARQIGMLPPTGIPVQEAADAVKIMQDGGELSCNCGMPEGPHYHMDKNKA